jgi:hypothetical protein
MDWSWPGSMHCPDFTFFAIWGGGGGCFLVKLTFINLHLPSLTLIGLDLEGGRIENRTA